MATRTISEVPRLSWLYLPVNAAEAHIFGADAALAFAFIRYTQAARPNWKPSVRQLAADVPGLSNHRARFVCLCYEKKLVTQEADLKKLASNMKKFITDQAAKGRNYKRLKLKGTMPDQMRDKKLTPIENAVFAAKMQLQFIERYL